MLKIIAYFHFRKDLPPDDCLRHWKERHPDVVQRCIPGAERYIQNVPVKISDRSWPFDGVSELWFKDMDAVKRGFAPGPLQDELHQDEARFSEGEVTWLLVSEREVW